MNLPTHNEEKLTPEELQERWEAARSLNRYAIHNDQRMCEYCGKWLDPGEQCGCPNADAYRERMRLSRRGDIYMCDCCFCWRNRGEQCDCEQSKAKREK